MIQQFPEYRQTSTQNVPGDAGVFVFHVHFPCVLDLGSASGCTQYYRIDAGILPCKGSGCHTDTEHWKDIKAVYFNVSRKSYRSRPCHRYQPAAILHFYSGVPHPESGGVQGEDPGHPVTDGNGYGSMYRLPDALCVLRSVKLCDNDAGAG